MTPSYVAVQAGWRIDRALDEVRRFGREDETLNTLYVVGEEGRLIDALPLQRFILAPPAAPVSGILDRTFVAVPATAADAAGLLIYFSYAALLLRR